MSGRLRSKSVNTFHVKSWQGAPKTHETHLTEANYVSSWERMCHQEANYVSLWLKEANYVSNSESASFQVLIVSVNRNNMPSGHNPQKLAAFDSCCLHVCTLFIAQTHKALNTAFDWFWIRHLQDMRNVLSEHVCNRYFLYMFATTGLSPISSSLPWPNNNARTKKTSQRTFDTAPENVAEWKLNDFFAHKIPKKINSAI